jgi:hypothetical protein
LSASLSCSSLRAAVCTSFHVGQTHVHCPFGEADPAIAAGIVCHLLMGETVHQGAEHVDVSGIGHAGCCEALTGERIELECERIGVLRGLETGDGPLKEELMAYDILTREPHEHLHELDEGIAGVVAE